MRLPSFLRRFAPEAKSLAAPSADLLEIFGVTPAASGITVSADAALRVPAVSAAIRTISEAAGSLDLMVKRAEGATEVDEPEHPVARLLRGDVNPWTSGHELIAHLVANALCHDGGGLAVVSRSGDGRLLEVVQANVGTITCTRDRATDEPTFTTAGRTLDPADVIWLRSPLGRAPLGLARDAIAVAVVLERHAGHLFGRGARPSGALMFPKGMGEEAVRKARTAWRATHEGDDAGGRTAILFDGAEFKPFQLSSVDAQFLELRRFQLEEIARAFNIPAPMIGDLSRATWANLESKHREFWSTTLEPWLRSLEAALARALLTAEEREHLVIRFDRDDFGRADLSARATSINSLIASRVLSPNEGRGWLGLAPRDGGDEFANPNITAEKPQASPPAQSEEEPTDDA